MAHSQACLHPGGCAVVAVGDEGLHLALHNLPLRPDLLPSGSVLTDARGSQDGQTGFLQTQSEH